MHTDPDSRLTDEQQVQAQRRIQNFYWLNGISVACVMENTLLLWALQNGLSAPRVAVIASFTFMAMPFMFFGKTVSARLGLVRAHSLCWMIRYGFVLLMIPIPWLRGGADDFLAPGVITACCFAFFVFRSMGMINTVPLIGVAAGPDRIGSFHAGIGARGNLSYFITLILVVWLLRGRDTPGTYQGILSVGCLVGIISAVVLRGTPEPPGLRKSARIRLRDVARDFFRNRTCLRLALAWSASTVAMALMIPIAMLALKQGYGVPDNTALGFTLVELVGVIAAAAVLTVIADHTGPRPIILLSMIAFLGVAGFWAFAPETFYPVVVGLVFLLGGVCRSGLQLGLSHYLLATSTAQNRLGIGMLLQMISGAASRVAGSVIGAGLLRVLPAWAGEGLPLYQTYYRILIGLVVLLAVAVARLPRLTDWAIRDVIGLIVSFRDLRALVALNRLRHAQTDDDDEAQLEHLTRLASRYSEPVLNEFLRTGRFALRARAILALSRIPFGEATVQALIKEVREGVFTNGWRAAELLGQRRITEAVPVLREGLASDDPYLSGKCMVALARLDDRDSLEKIRALFRASSNARVVIHGAQAMEIIRAPDDVLLLLNKCIDREWTQPVRDELLLAVAAICGKKRQLYRLFRAAAMGEGAPAAPSIGVGRGRPVLADPYGAHVQAFLSEHPWDTLPPRMRWALSGFLAS